MEVVGSGGGKRDLNLRFLVSKRWVFISSCLVGMLVHVGREWFGHDPGGGNTWSSGGVGCLKQLFQPLCKRW